MLCISSSAHFDNKKKDILIFGKGSTQVLDDITLTAEKEYTINLGSTVKILFKLAL